MGAVRVKGSKLVEDYGRNKDTAKRQGQHKGDIISRIETVVGITVMITVDFSTMNNQESSNPIQV